MSITAQAGGRFTLWTWRKIMLRKSGCEIVGRNHGWSLATV